MTPETRAELEAVEVNDLPAAVAVARKIVAEEGGRPLAYIVVQALILRFDDPDPLLDALAEIETTEPGPA